MNLVAHDPRTTMIVIRTEQTPTGGGVGPPGESAAELTHPSIHATSVLFPTSPFPSAKKRDLVCSRLPACLHNLRLNKRPIKKSRRSKFPVLSFTDPKPCKVPDPDPDQINPSSHPRPFLGENKKESYGCGYDRGCWCWC